MGFWLSRQGHPALHPPAPSSWPAQALPRLSWRPRQEPGRSPPCRRTLDGASGQGLLRPLAPAEPVKAGLGPSDH